MSHFRRSYVPGGSFFFTVVTEQRTPILCTDTSRVFLRTAIRECRQEWPFRIDAMVFLENPRQVRANQSDEDRIGFERALPLCGVLRAAELRPLAREVRNSALLERAGFRLLGDTAIDRLK